MSDILLFILLHTRHKGIPKEVNKHAGYVCTVFLVDILATSTERDLPHFRQFVVGF